MQSTAYLLRVTLCYLQGRALFATGSRAGPARSRCSLFQVRPMMNRTHPSRVGLSPRPDTKRLLIKDVEMGSARNLARSGGRVWNANREIVGHFVKFYEWEIAIMARNPRLR